MPYLYFLVLLTFLSLYSFLITLQIYKLVQLELLLRNLFFKEINSYSTKELFLFLRALSSKKLWFSSLKLVESQTSIPSESQHYYFNAIGVIYQNMNKYDLAKLYYLKSLQKQKNYPTALKNLALLNKECTY